MKTLYESIMDVDKNVDDLDKNILIGGHYYIDLGGIKCSHLKDVFKIGLIKMKQPREIIEGPEIDWYDDPKVCKMIEVLCAFILNLPLKCLDERHSKELDIVSDYMKFQYGRCHLGSTVGGMRFFRC